MATPSVATFEVRRKDSEGQKRGTCKRGEMWKALAAICALERRTDHHWIREQNHALLKC